MGGSPAVALLEATSITVGWSGVLAESRGGTNQSTYATGDILYASAANTLSKLTAGADGEVLTLAGGVPTWSAATGGIAIGDTITGATAGSVLFAGALGVLAQDNTNFFWDDAANNLIIKNTLTLGDASASNGQLVLRNSANAFTTTIQTGVTGASYTLTLPTTDGAANEFLQTNGSGVLTWAAAGNGITIGTTTITSGTTTRILYDNAGVVGEYTLTGSGTVVAMQTSPTFVTDITTPSIIGGTAVGSQVIIKPTTGVGTSTVAGIVHNVGNNGAINSMNWLNNGNVGMGATSLTTLAGTSYGGKVFMIAHDTTATQLVLRATTGTFPNIALENNSSTATYRVCSFSHQQNFFAITFVNETGLSNTTTNALVVDRLGNAGLNNSNGTDFGTNAARVFAIRASTAPTTSIADQFMMYEADYSGGGTGCAFIRNENGAIIKLAQETTAVAASAFVANTSGIVNDTATFGGYTIGQIVGALKAQGLLA